MSVANIMGITSITPITIYHNPTCGTSRNTLAMIRNSGVEPSVINYLIQPPTRAKLQHLIDAAGLSVRDTLRQKGTPNDELGLADPPLTDDALLDAMLQHPILINRPFVVSPLGVRLCRPSELVLHILPDAQRGPLCKEDGQPVFNTVDHSRKSVSSP